MNSSIVSTPLSSIDNYASPVPARRTLDQLEGTPVGDRDKGSKIQLCFELRKKEISTQRASKKIYKLLLEVAVLHLKNLPKPREGRGKQEQTFVKIEMGEVIHSTELKRSSESEAKVDMNFMEVFEFPLEKAQDLEGKRLELLVCDKKMTRNATIFGKTEITGLESIKINKPVCKWFNLSGNGHKVKHDLNQIFSE